MVDNNSNKRDSDIFNTKNNTTYQNSSNNRSNRSRIIEVSERLIDNKMRTSSPYYQGKRNDHFISKSLNTTNDIDAGKNRISKRPVLSKSIDDKGIKDYKKKSHNYEKANNEADFLEYKNKVFEDGKVKKIPNSQFDFNVR